jgi:uncharacterized protein YbjT (DUF2867 family)
LPAITRVTLVGGSGRLGTFILDKVLGCSKFDVQVVKRAGSASTFAAGTKVVEADFTDLGSLKTAFEGQDAVVSVVGEAGVAGQKILVDAAIAAGVKRFLPSNFGSNMANPNSRKLPVFTSKVIVEDYIIEKATTTPLTYSFVYVGGFTDFTLQKRVIMVFSTYSPKIFNGGDTQFSSTSMPTVGDAVVGVLSNPAETRNRSVYVSEIITSQNKPLSIAKQIASDRPWAPVDVDLNVVAEAAKERLAQVNHDLSTLIPILLKSIVDPEYGVKFTKNDNELLGIKPKTDEYLVELITPLIPL